MNFFHKMERRFGRYAISDLIKYFIMLRIIGAVISVIDPNIYLTYLCFDIEAIMQGQIWRLVTFILQPISSMNILFFALELYLYYLFGTSLENAWGKFLFNLYFLSGILFNIMGGVIIYYTIGMSVPIGLDYIYKSMFFAFAILYPDMQFNLWFLIPVKAKWLAYFYGIYIGWDVIDYLIKGIQATNSTDRNDYFAIVSFILISFANFFLYFFISRRNRFSPKQMQRRSQYKKQIKRPVRITKHKCAICGRTEEDDENLEFRFCSKCDGNYEYCSEHLFTHNHVHKY